MVARKKNEGGDMNFLHVGNALSVALECGEYDLVAELAKKKVAMQDGKSVVYWYNAEHSLQMDFVETECVLKELLQKGERMPEDVWYVGDQYQCDIVGATNAGLFPVWYIGAIDMKYEPHEEILTINNWKILKELLKKPQATARLTTTKSLFMRATVLAV